MKLFDSVIGKKLAFPNVIRVEKLNGLFGINDFVIYCNKIRDSFARIALINTVKAFKMRVGDLSRIFAYLNFWNNFSAFILDCGKLIYAAENR